jgi:hypothetical protein
MRSTFFVSLFSLFLVFVFTGESLAGEAIKRYKVESGIVEFTMTGTQKGTVILYFDKWGMRESKFSDLDLSMMGIDRKTNSLNIMDSEWMYSIDLETKEGTKLQNSFFQNLIEQSKEDNLTDLGEQMMKNMGGEKIGTEEICGKMCDVWDIPRMQTKSWVWNGISLKIKTNMQGMESTTIATSLKVDVKIPDEKFQVPEGVTIVERDFGDFLNSVKPKKEVPPEKESESKNEKKE